MNANWANLKKFFELKSPAILTGIGVAGVIVTAVASGKATLEARERIDVADVMAEARGETLTKADKFKRVWTAYIPTAVSAAASITCILGAHNINVRRQAAMVVLYQVAERGFDEYREQVLQQIGENEERKIRDRVAEKQAKDTPLKSAEIYVTGTGSSLFFDSLSGRYFESDMERIRRAENDMNYLILHEMYGTLNQFYGKIGLSGTEMGEDVGWDTERRLDILYTTMISDDNRPCMVINYRTKPVEDFGKWR